VLKLLNGFAIDCGMNIRIEPATRNTDLGMQWTGAQVCVVGDDDQQSTSGMEAILENILSYIIATHRHTVPMGDNFRSNKGVVETARQIVERTVSGFQRKWKSGVATF